MDHSASQARGGTLDASCQEVPMSLRLLIVLGGIGLTVAAFVFVIPTCACTTPEHATRSRLKSELRNLATEEEVYFADHSTYTRDLDAMSFSPSHASR